jgi:sterol O-acyltransferase
MSVTFLPSAAAHELVMAVVTKKIRCTPGKPPFLFVKRLICWNVLVCAATISIPMIAVARSPVITRNKFLGNAMIWLALYAGFPLLCVAYVFP